MCMYTYNLYSNIYPPCCCFLVYILQMRVFIAGILACGILAFICLVWISFRRLRKADGKHHLITLSQRCHPGHLY